MTVRVISDEAFLENVRDARVNGYDLVCAECGVGIYDESDMHMPACSHAEPFDGR